MERSHTVHTYSGDVVVLELGNRVVAWLKYR
jgi:hypothetical protein